MKRGPVALYSNNCFVWIIFLTIAVSEHVGAKHVFNIVIPEEETSAHKNKRLYDEQLGLFSVDGGLF